MLTLVKTLWVDEDKEFLLIQTLLTLFIMILHFHENWIFSWKLIFFMKIDHYQETLSLWWKSIIVIMMKFFVENSSRWWRFIALMKIHRGDEKYYKNSMSLWLWSKCVNPMKYITMTKVLQWDKNFNSLMEFFWSDKYFWVW